MIFRTQLIHHSIYTHVRIWRNLKYIYYSHRLIARVMTNSFTFFFKESLWDSIIPLNMIVILLVHDFVYSYGEKAKVFTLIHIAWVLIRDRIEWSIYITTNIIVWWPHSRRALHYFIIILIIVMYTIIIILSTPLFTVVWLELSSIQHNNINHAIKVNIIITLLQFVPHYRKPTNTTTCVQAHCVFLDFVYPQ